MARIELDFPENVYRFSVEMPVRYPDINIGRHLGADKLVTMLNEARDQFFAFFDQPDNIPGQIYTMMTDLLVVYRAEIPPRSTLRFDLGAMDFNVYGGNIATRVTRVADGVVAARARSGFVFFDPERQKVTPAPQTFVAKFR